MMNRQKFVEVFFNMKFFVSIYIIESWFCKIGIIMNVRIINRGQFLTLMGFKKNCDFRLDCYWD